MGRNAKLGKKNGYWYSEAGGTPRYYGRVGEVSYGEAVRLLRKQLAEPTEPSVPTIADLADRFIEWMGNNRDQRNRDERARHLRRWCVSCGGMRADTIRRDHLEEFIERLRSAGHAPEYIQKHVTTVKMLFRRAVKLEWLPPMNPFAGVEPIHVPLDPLAEGDLITRSEVEALFKWADADLESVHFYNGSRPRRPDEYRIGAANPWRGFEDMLRVYYSTGARTGELWTARVGDFQRVARQLILGKHKRSRTQKVATVRQIILNEATYGILERLCEGRPVGAPIFTRPIHGQQLQADRSWSKNSIASRFRSVRKLAGVRDDITIYSFRHLWISEMLMAGVDALLVAKMAGTSLAMIEKVYGHFRNQSYQDAQARLDAERARRSEEHHSS